MTDPPETDRRLLIQLSVVHIVPEGLRFDRTDCLETVRTILESLEDSPARRAALHRRHDQQLRRGAGGADRAHRSGVESGMARRCCRHRAPQARMWKRLLGAGWTSVGRCDLEAVDLDLGRSVLSTLPVYESPQAGREGEEATRGRWIGRAFLLLPRTSAAAAIVDLVRFVESASRLPSHNLIGAVRTPTAIQAVDYESLVAHVVDVYRFVASAVAPGYRHCLSSRQHVTNR